MINNQGQCPYCGSGELDYEPVTFEDTMVYFNYTCNVCHQAGQEWYGLEFAGHNVKCNSCGDTSEWEDNALIKSDMGWLCDRCERDYKSRGVDL